MKTYKQASYINIIILHDSLFYFIWFTIYLVHSAGWTAALVGSMIFLWQWLKRKHTIKVKPTLLKSGFLLFITVFIISIYFIRRDSADGRLLIWYNTIKMIEDFPLFGIGTGGWQANYMLYQAEYFLQATNSPLHIIS
jgi:O-antigen ligase